MLLICVAVFTDVVCVANLNVVSSVVVVLLSVTTVLVVGDVVDNVVATAVVLVGSSDNEVKAGKTKIGHDES